VDGIGGFGNFSSLGEPRLRIEFAGQYVKVSEAKVKGYP
jgi:hypothetical protein